MIGFIQVSNCDCRQGTVASINIFLVKNKEVSREKVIFIRNGCILYGGFQ